MKILLLLTFSLFISFAQSENREDLLRALDKEVANNHFYIQQKEKEINALKETLQAATFGAEQYLVCKRLYKAYQKFDCDSAIRYANQCLQYGIAENRNDWIKESELNIIKIYSLRSFQPFASRALEEYEKNDSILPPLQTEYITTLFENNIRIRNAAQGTRYEQECREEGEQLWNKYKPYLPKDFWSYTYYEYALTNKKIDIEDRIRTALEKTKPYSEERALLEINLAIQLKDKGDEEGYFKHLILSAICDIRSANREAQALLFITQILQHDKSQVERAFNYALLCEENAGIYRDYGRSMDLISSQSFIQKTYKEQIERQRLWMCIILCALVAALVIVVILFFLLKKKQSIQTDYLNEITEKNNLLKSQFRRIKEIVQRTKTTNVLLANKVKDRDSHFMNVFYLYSESLQNLKNFRKKTEHLLKNGMTNEANRFVTSFKLDDELQKLYQQFDKAFLAIHPDFIDKFNELLTKDEQIIIQKPDTLNPVLRIYALIYLGITNSVNIADFLHYSPQTVYNYRLKARRAASMPEDDFENAIQNLYAEKEEKEDSDSDVISG